MGRAELPTPGDHLRVQFENRHQVITGLFFSFLFFSFLFFSFLFFSFLSFPFLSFPFLFFF